MLKQVGHILARQLLSSLFFIALAFNPVYATTSSVPGSFSLNSSDIDSIVSKDIQQSELPKAISDLLKAANKGDKEAQYMLFACYRGYDCGVDPNGDESFKWLVSAANNRHTTAMFILGYNYFIGVGKYNSKSIAFDWFDKSYKNGFLLSAIPLSYYYLNSVGVQEDKKRAFELLKAVAKFQHPGATYDLALMYANGWGTDQNIKTATVLMKVSAKLGYSKAIESLPALQYHRCNNYKVHIFGLLAQCTDRSEYRSKLLENGFKPIRTDNSFWHDIYSGSFKDKEIEKIIVGYTSNAALSEVALFVSKEQYDYFSKLFSDELGVPTDKNTESNGFHIDSLWKLDENVYISLKTDKNSNYFIQYIIVDNYNTMKSDIANKTPIAVK